jgi:bidirectional [NiFe] hydrogenase diaphorase subunit
MTPEELGVVAEKERAEQGKFKHCLGVCLGTACMSSHSDRIKGALEKQVAERGLKDTVLIKQVGCQGLCASGPMVSLDTDNVMYQQVKAEDVDAMLDGLETKPVDRLVIDTTQPFFQSQLKIVLENTGHIDPERIEAYIARGGYQALLKTLHEMSPAGVIDTITRSGLRGRGGAGFPTGIKWATVAKATGERKFVICNGDEGDPGAFMDRSVMEGDPHRLLEGMAIAAYAVGAHEGFLYVRAEYPLAVKRLKLAIKQAEKAGLLGNNIANTGFDLKLEVRLGAGAFVCGEETALIASIEGGRGNPRPRPPFPAVSGLWGCPTLINNVETYANIAPIVRKGAEWFASIGTEKSKGTKVFALTGKVKNVGLIEVPMGISLRTIVEDIGGGIPDGHTFKAVQTGGPSGGCIPAEYLDMPVDFESLAKVGSIMGSGGMIVMDETSSMVEVARFFMEFCKDESCGKCIPCRAGTAQIYNLLTKFIDGDASEQDIATLEELCDVVKFTSLCGLGQSAPNPVLSTLRYFRHEYEALLDGRRGTEDGKHTQEALVAA